MQKLFYTLLLITSLSINAQTQNSYPMDSQRSVLNWKGTYAFQFSEHHGTVQFKEGWIKTKNKTVTDGFFIIDMTTITNADHKLKQGPVEHLKNDDFFDVPAYPEAKLKFTKVTYFEDENLHKIEANFCGHSHVADIVEMKNIIHDHSYRQFMCGSMSSRTVPNEPNMYFSYENFGTESEKFILTHMYPDNCGIKFVDSVIGRKI